MNIPNKFDLYLENKLSKGEKIQFEKELSEHPELAQSYKAYSKINRVLEKELSSPLLNADDDPILNELSLSQRLEIEEDFRRFYSNENADPEHNLRASDNSDIPDAANSNLLPAHEKPEEEKTDLRRFLKVLNKSSNIKTKAKYTFNWIYIGIAATVVLFFFAGKIIFSFSFSGNKKLSPQEIYANYYNPTKDKEIKSLIFTDSRLENFILDFKRSNISSSGIFSNQLEVSDDDYELSLLYLGLINLERNDFPEARRCFTRMLSIKNSKKSYIANFYISLSYLNEGNSSEAKPLLDKLAETRNPYRKKAKAILQSLKQK